MIQIVSVRIETALSDVTASEAIRRVEDALGSAEFEAGPAWAKLRFETTGPLTVETLTQEAFDERVGRG